MEAHAEYLAKNFMENVVLSFGMVAILLIDITSPFKSVIKDIFTSNGLIYWNLARGNHKAMSVEKYHHFLNKTQEIAD